MWLLIILGVYNELVLVCVHLLIISSVDSVQDVCVHVCKFTCIYMCVCCLLLKLGNPNLKDP